jgi:hypothetical protein
VYAGHAAGQLPSSPEALAVVERLVEGWCDGYPAGADLAAALKRVRADVRALFDRLFG